MYEVFYRQWIVLGCPVPSDGPVWDDLVRYAYEAFYMSARECEMSLTRN